MTDNPPAKTGAGYTVDPYKDEGAECDDLISKLFEPISGKGGILSTWRERHIAIAGAVAGYRAGTAENVPDCPPLWVDECQYFNGFAMLVNLTKSQWPGIVGLVGGIAALKVSGFTIPGIV
jgi:hypothetical protein